MFNGEDKAVLLEGVTAYDDHDGDLTVEAIYPFADDTKAKVMYAAMDKIMIPIAQNVRAELESRRVTGMGFSYDKALVAAKQIPCVNLLLHVIQTTIVSVGNNGVGYPFEFLQIPDNPTAKEGRACRKRRLKDHNCGSFCLDPFHDSLYRGVPEIV